MKRLLLFSMIFISLVTHAAPSVAHVRELFKKAIVEKESCMQLLQLLKDYTENNHPLFAGYKGCATMVMAKHVFNPASKYSYFSSGKQLLEKAIAADPANTELIFLRFGIQTNIPRFLNYKMDISKDKAVLIKMTPYVKDEDLKANIISVLKNSAYVNAGEKQLISLNMKIK
jgi:hypothetical protein